MELSYLKVSFALYCTHFLTIPLDAELSIRQQVLILEQANILNDAKSRNINTACVLAILCMKMRGIVFVVKHSDDDTEEITDLRHIDFVVSTVQRSSLLME